MKVENVYLEKLEEDSVAIGKFSYNKAMQFKFGSSKERWKRAAKKIETLIGRFRKKEISLEEFKKEVIAYRLRMMKKYPEEFPEDGKMGWYDYKKMIEMESVD